MNNKTNNYETPQVEIVELELEGVICGASNEGQGKDEWLG